MEAAVLLYPSEDGSFRAARHALGPAVSVISRQVSVLRHMKGTRASQYFAWIAWRVRANSSGGRMRAVAGNSGPMTFPRMVQGAILTCGLLRMRLHFPNLLF